MRRARVVGLSKDGSALFVATDSGEELAVPVDEQLRAAVRGDRPRLGQLEFEMDSALSPREIQARIRSGQSLADVSRVAGMPEDRVERFAAPVLAEREHIARLALSASVRRRGETSAHRTLRATLVERLSGRGVDLDTLGWDSHRREDGRWAVTADYRSGGAERQAVFYFDVAGRYSVAGNDDARWVLGEQSSAKGPQPGRRRPDGADADSGDDDYAEPTLDLDDELALVRAISEPPVTDTGRLYPDDRAADEAPEHLATVQPIRPLPAPVADAQAPDAEVPDAEKADEPAQEGPAGTGDPDQEPAAAGTRSEMDTLEDFLDGDGYTEDSVRVYAGLSEPPAVPETAVVRGAGWEPAIVVDFPVEPSPVDASADASAEGTDEPGAPDPPTGLADRAAEADALENEQSHPTPDLAAAPGEPVAEDSGDVPASAPVRPARRKRAAVPSWDEIMFGSPRNPS